MTEFEIINTLSTLTIEQQVRWMLLLGHNLTVAARNFYEAGTENAEGKPLRGFNEIQHRVHARILNLRDGHEWTLESFVAMLHEHALFFNIQRDVAWAIKKSMPAQLN